MLDQFSLKTERSLVVLPYHHRFLRAKGVTALAGSVNLSSSQHVPRSLLTLNETGRVAFARFALGLQANNTPGRV